MEEEFCKDENFILVIEPDGTTTIIDV